jgi:hypothetical protein
MKSLLLLIVSAFCLLQICQGQNQGYVLSSNHTAESFFDGFFYFTEDDPTHGYVNFVDEDTAHNNGLVKIENGKVFMYADSYKIASGRGRDAIRIVSKKTWYSGLFVLSLDHMPSGCGTWPAWWMVGPNWPFNGEIDILEGVNLQTSVATTLHTGEGCIMNADHSTYSGSPVTPDCFIYSPTQAGNQGCGILAEQGSYGEPLNKRGGGVFVTELQPTGIRSWFFAHNNTPADLIQNMPNPDRWVKPYGNFPFGSSCAASHFQNLSMVFDLTFCGEWAGNVWGQTCSSKGPDCVQYVRNNPSAFAEAYWSINYLKVFSLEAVKSGAEPRFIAEKELQPVNSGSSVLSIGLWALFGFVFVNFF